MAASKSGPSKQERRELLKAYVAELLEFASSVVPEDLAREVVAGKAFRTKIEDNSTRGMVFHDFCKRQFMRCDEVLDHLHEAERHQLLEYVESLLKNTAGWLESVGKHCTHDGVFPLLHRKAALWLVHEQLRVVKRHRSDFDALSSTYVEWTKRTFGRNKAMIEFLYLPQKGEIEAWAARTDSEMFRDLRKHFMEYQNYPIEYTEERHAELCLTLNTKFLYYIQECSAEFNPMSDPFDQYAKRIIGRLYCGRHHIDNHSRLEKNSVTWAVTRTCCRSSPEHEELKQHAFTHLISKAASFDFRRGNKWSTWAESPIKNSIVDFYRQKKRIKENDGNAISDVSDIPDKAWESTSPEFEVGPLLKKCLDSLSQTNPALYEAVVACIIQGKPKKEHAHSRGVGAPAITNAIGRGTDALRACLKKYGVKAI